MSLPIRKVARMKTVGGQACVELHEEALPQLGPHDVLVQVHANSINFHDLAVITGVVGVPDGRIPLCDAAGLIVETGSDVTQLRTGDRVLSTFFPDWIDGAPRPDPLSRISGDTADGFAADLVVVPEHCFTAMPAGMDYEKAATIPCAGVTAWNALSLAGELTRDIVVVVQGTGGVAIWALQLAKAMNARVVALTTSAGKVGMLHSLGADLVIDQRAEPNWDRAVRSFSGGRGADLILEVVGGKNLAVSVSACRMGGKLVLIGFLADVAADLIIPDLLLNHIQVCGLAVGSHADQMRLVKFIEDHSIDPVVGEVIPFDRLGEVGCIYKHNSLVGKMIISH